MDQLPGYKELQGILGELHGIIPVRMRDYDLYILEQPSSWSTLRILPSGLDPGLD